MTDLLKLTLAIQSEKKGLLHERAIARFDARLLSRRRSRPPREA